LGAVDGLLTVDFAAACASTRGAAGGCRQENDDGDNGHGEKVMIVPTEEGGSQFGARHGSPSRDVRRPDAGGEKQQSA
jgi:hypothetical protein